MPSITTQDSQAIAGSFLGLQSYTEAQSNLFFGRDTETDTLTSLIELNTLTIVFGRSGTGKTSLLNAGVFPRLRKSFCLPFRIRLEFNDNSPDLITQVKKVLKEEIDKYGFKVDSYPLSETLWEYFHKEPLWKTVTPILVFDQFEEIFTLAKSNPRFSSVELPVFWDELSNLIENNIPEKLKEKFLEQKEKIEYNYKKQKAKIVFSFREEYLPEFESIAPKIPSLKYSRFRLLPMNGNQAYEVITKTWKENITAKEAKHLVSYFTNEPGIEDQSFVTVEPSLLSQVCAYIDKERIASGGGRVSAELLNKYPKETILRSIYNEAIIAANSSLNLPKEKEANKNLIKIFVEEKLITSEGYRTRYNLSADDENLKPGINVLTTKYFIREDDNVIELTHDVLAPIIKTDREKRRKEIAGKKIRRRALIFVLFPVTLLLIGSLLWAENERKKAVIAKEVRESAEKATLKLKADSIRLDSLIIAMQAKKNAIDEYIKSLDPSSKKKEIDTLNQELAKLIAQSQELKRNMNFSRLEINELRKEQDSLELIISNTPIVSNMDTRQLIAKIKLLENDTLIKARKIRELEIQIAAAKSTINALNNRNPSSTAHNLRIQVYDNSGSGRVPITDHSFDIYIIPLNHKNKEILEKNKSFLYNKNCDDFSKLLEDLVNEQKAYYENGYYYPPNVLPNGKYKIKICNILDGYFELKLPSSSGSVFWKLAPRDKVEIKLGRF